MPAVHKFFEAQVKTEDINESERTIVASITTETMDREKEIVVARGGDLANYRKNPVVLWCHKYDMPPVAKNLWIKGNGAGLIAKTQYAATERAEEIWQLRKGGFLKGYSIGFVPKSGKYGAPTDQECKAAPHFAEARCIIREWELVEYSDVPVPCNPDALSLAYHGKALKLSSELVKDLHIPEAPAIEVQPVQKASTKMYFLSDTQLRKAMAKELEEIDFEAIAKPIVESIPAIVAEQFRLARGGV